jgi:hypothetical protein
MELLLAPQLQISQRKNRAESSEGEAGIGFAFTV